MQNACTYHRLQCIVLGFVTIVSILGFNGQLVGQNLIINPSFETHVTCPERQGAMQLVPDWGGFPNTSDYYHRCGVDGVTAVPWNDAGYQEAAHGDAYCGIIARWGNVGYDYIYQELATPLDSGVEYCVGYYYSCADNPEYVTDDLCVIFTEEFPPYVERSTFECAISTQRLKFLGNTKEWEAVSGSFVATGREKYIVIGSSPDRGRPLIKRDLISDFAPSTYYYIDNVFLRSSGIPPDWKLPVDTLFSCKRSTMRVDAGVDMTTYRWSTGDTTRSIVVSEPGTYWVDVSIPEFCKIFRNYVNIDFDWDRLAQSHFYPNPAMENIHIDLYTDEPSNAYVELVDLFGTYAGSFEYQLNSGHNKIGIDLSTYDPGTYIVEARSACRRIRDKVVLVK